MDTRKHRRAHQGDAKSTMKIVVATDGSAGGIAAVRFAARLAARDPTARVVLLTIGGAKAGRRSPPGATESDSILASAAVQMRSFGLADRCDFLALSTRQEVPEAISALADRLRADLVVVGSEGRDTLAEWVVGGVALRLIYMAKRPVVVVRPKRRHAAA